MIYLDTHIVVWLFAGMIEKLRPEIIGLLERSELRISPMVRLELAFLYEIGRITYSDSEILEELSQSIELIECPKSFGSIVKTATSLTWTRDPFDRIIVAQALVHDAPLLTYDQRIARYYPKTVG